MIKKIGLIFLCWLFVSGTFLGCEKKTDEFISDISSDFTFGLTWDCYGISSYDSVTGKLVKTREATNPDDYITTLVLDDERKENVRNILSKIDFSKYPSEYNPNEGIESDPSMTLILVLKYGNTTRSISCKDIAISYESSNTDGQIFLSACKSIIDIIINTDEWKALPEYEFFYE